MNMNLIGDFHFLRPYLLVLLVLPILYLLKLGTAQTIHSAWSKVCDEYLLRFLLLKDKNKQYKFPRILAALISVFIILAAAGPTWVKRQNPALSVDNPVMLIINLSSDMWSKDVSPSRIVRAQYSAKDMLKAFKSTESGLMVYSREPFMLTPLTEDKALLENLLPEIIGNIMPENGDRLDRAIDMAVERMQNSGYAKGNLIVWTADVGERFDAALESAHSAAEKGFDVNIIKVSGSENEKLKMIAEKGNGIYLNYQQNPDNLITKINDIYTAELKLSHNMQTVWEDMGYYLFWLPGLLLLYYFRRGFIIVLFGIFIVSEANAGWFLNNNQEAMKYFNQGNYAAAAAKFDNAKWRASAAYKNKSYDEAYEYFSKNDDTVSLYNQGNALAKAGKIPEAIKKYEQVLERDAEFEDAAFNLDYLKKMQQQQQRQQEQKQRQQQQSEQDKQQQSAQQNSGAGQQDNDARQEDEQQQNQGDNGSQSSQAQNADEQTNTEADDKESSDNAGDSEKNENTEQNSAESSSAVMNNSEREGEETPAEAQSIAMYGAENENSEQEAKVKQTQAGEQSAEEKEKIRARMQKFREIPEDRGGLLRALIAKEYGRNRYKDRR